MKIDTKLIKYIVAANGVALAGLIWGLTEGFAESPHDIAMLKFVGIALADRKFQLTFLGGTLFLNLMFTVFWFIDGWMRKDKSSSL